MTTRCVNLCLAFVLLAMGAAACAPPIAEPYGATAPAAPPSQTPAATAGAAEQTPSQDAGEGSIPTPTPALTTPAAPPAAGSRTPTPPSADRPGDVPTLPQPSDPTVWEQDLLLNTYGWHDALIPTDPGDIVYPYPRLDFDAVGGPAPRTYRAVYIQNDYVQLVVLPELGGRLLRWTDRTTGRQLFYANPVIKPTGWGYRSWWLATGGMEWAFPTDEHGLNEYRPWQTQLLWNGVRVWDTDDRTGMTVEVTISLDAERSAFTLVPRITNPTGEPQPYQFWANAMLTLSDSNAPSPELTFVLPDDAVTVHSTSDGSLPDPGGQMAWPVYDGRDFSRYGEWRHYLGVFADPAQAGFFGAYDPSSDQGLVRVFPPATATGVKIFCMGEIPSSRWTDDGSRYFELWGGLTPTFWDYWTLEPGASVSWTEQWYPVSGIGGYNWANADAAIRLTPSGDSAGVAVATSRALRATVVLRRGGENVQQWQATIAPGQPFLASGGPASNDGDWGVQVLAGGPQGTIIAQMGP